MPRRRSGRCRRPSVTTRATASQRPPAPSGLPAGGERGQPGRDALRDLVRRAVCFDDHIAMWLGSGHVGKQPPDPDVLLTCQPGR